jgi:large subunit ribosomal protein L3
MVDVTGISKGKGFAGVVKRHHFAGGPKTHGQSDRHRAPGSVGASSTPGRVFKGMRMAGQLGNRRNTVLNLEIVDLDVSRNLVLIKGAVPGPKNGIVVVRKAVKSRS